MSNEAEYFPHLVVDEETGETEWSIMPDDYGNPMVEHRAVRESIGLYDFSCHFKIDVVGPQAECFLQKLTVNDITRINIDEAIYTTVTNEHGHIIDDLVIYRLGKDHFRLISGLEDITPLCSWLDEWKRDFEVELIDVTNDYTEICVQGPLSGTLMNSLCAGGVKNLQYFEATWTEIANCKAYLSRTGYSGELGYEIYASPEDGKTIWDTLRDEGKRFSLQLVGMDEGGVHIPLEKGYICELDFAGGRNPYEIGLGWTVRLDKDFIGRDVLREIKTAGVSHRLMGFEVLGSSQVVEFESEARFDGKKVGLITNTGYSHTFGKSIGLVYLEREYAEPGLHITIVDPQGEFEGLISNKNRYDPANTRVKKLITS